MLGQVDIGTLAQRRTNGWQMVGLIFNIGPSSAQHWHVYGVSSNIRMLPYEDQEAPSSRPELKKVYFKNESRQIEIVFSPISMAQE